jgi:hypothetical protein
MWPRGCGSHWASARPRVWTTGCGSLRPSPPPPTPPPPPPPPHHHHHRGLCGALTPRGCPSARGPSSLALLPPPPAHTQWPDNWQQGEEILDSIIGANPTFWLNYLMATFPGRWGPRPATSTPGSGFGLRPLTMGRAGGLGSHRYAPLGFSGDVIPSWDNLHFQVRVWMWWW